MVPKWFAELKSYEELIEGVLKEMMVNKKEYNPLIVVENTEAKNARKIARLQKEVVKLGFNLSLAKAS